MEGSLFYWPTMWLRSSCKVIHASACSTVGIHLNTLLSIRTMKRNFWCLGTQLYADVKSSLYWSRTFIYWLSRNIMEVTQSVYDSSLHFSPSFTTALVFHADVTRILMTERDLSVREKVTSSFKCYGYQFSLDLFQGTRCYARRKQYHFVA